MNNPEKIWVPQESPENTPSINKDQKPHKFDREDHQEAMRLVRENSSKEKELGKEDNAKIEAALNKELLEDFIARYQNFTEEFKDLAVDVSGEKHLLSLAGMRYQGEPITLEKLQQRIDKDAKNDDLNINKFSTDFVLTSTIGRAENLKLSFTIPVSRMLTFQAKAMLSRYITETFAGTTAYYQKLQADSVKSPKNERPATQSTHEQKATQQMAEALRSQVESLDGDVCLLESPSLTSIIVVLPDQQEQLRFSPIGLGQWQVLKVAKGTVQESTTGNPQEILEAERNNNK